MQLLLNLELYKFQYKKWLQNMFKIKIKMAVKNKDLNEKRWDKFLEPKWNSI